MEFYIAIWFHRQYWHHYVEVSPLFLYTVAAFLYFLIGALVIRLVVSPNKNKPDECHPVFLGLMILIWPFGLITGIFYIVGYLFGALTLVDGPIPPAAEEKK